MRHAFLIALLSCCGITAQNPYVRNNARIGTTADLRARSIGDILTITIDEKHTVKNDDKVERKQDSSLKAKLDTFTLSDSTFSTGSLPHVEVSKKQDFTGEAKQDLGSEVRASIAVVVIDVQPNGNLVVAGQRTVTVNDEVKTLKVSGLVRQIDVTSQNTVGSALVADARVAIQGEGANTRTTTKGPIGQLFDTLIWAVWPF
jgi:flagellar L-ring protein precursor FlgH